MIKVPILSEYAKSDAVEKEYLHNLKENRKQNPKFLQIQIQVQVVNDAREKLEREINKLITNKTEKGRETAEKKKREK